MVVRKSFDCKMLFTEKCATLEVEILLLCGHTEDLNPGDSLSNSSDGLLQRGKGVSQTLCQVVKLPKDYC